MNIFSYLSKGATRFLIRGRLIVAGLALTASLASQAFDLPVKTIDGKRCFYYTVGASDTSLSIAKALGVKQTDIYRYNQDAADGVRRGQVLYFPYDEFKDKFTPLSSVDQQDFATNDSGRRTHVVKDGETVFGISKQYGLSTDELVRLNPSVATQGVKPGMTLVLSELVTNSEPTITESTRSATPSSAVPAQNAPVTVPPIAEQENSLTPVKPKISEVSEDKTDVSDKSKSTIAVLLPFELSSAKLSKQAAQVTDFYRGMLLGADAMAVISPKVNIKTYDTGTTVADIDRVLAKPEVAEADIIIGPYSADQFTRVARYGAAHNTYVINPFIVRDTTYAENPYVIQLYIDSDRMLQKAVEQFLQYVNSGYTPVILDNTSGQKDKQAFVNLIENELSTLGITPETIKFDGHLSYEEVGENLIPSGNYVILPMSGSVGAFNKFCTSLAKYIEEDLAAGGGSAVVFGYPEWAAFKGRPLEQLAKLNAVYYSRFNVDDKSQRYKDADEMFKQWYGAGMLAGFPIQALQGYDLIEYLLATMKFTGSNLKKAREYEGVQAAYRLVTPNGKQGIINDALYIISVLPDGNISAEVK